jgi:prepilin-type N-terminal cleavage/methylation domain-containing protein
MSESILEGANQMERPRGPQAGFSLIELLVAMTITLIVSGAIYGLMTVGQNAFRREPELAERQQNIRLATDMMLRDIANAGTALPPFTQVFTTGLGGAGVTGPSGAASDDLEMLSVIDRESEPVCTAAGQGSVNEVSLYRHGNNPPVPVGTLVFLVFSEITPSATNAPETQDDQWTSRRLTAVPTDRVGPPSGVTWDACDPAVPHSVLTFANSNPYNPANLCANPTTAPTGNFAGGCGVKRITRAVFGQQVRYQVRNDPTDGVPVLQRISTTDGTTQTLARGIEELQVEYAQFSAPTTWLTAAPVVGSPTTTSTLPPPGLPQFGSLVKQVRLTITSRAESTRIQGAVNNAAGTNARIRGTMTTTASPRSALIYVSRGRPSPDPSPGIWHWE